MTIIRLLAVLAITLTSGSDLMGAARNYFDKGEPLKALYCVGVAILLLLFMHLANNLWRDAEQLVKREK